MAFSEDLVVTAGAPTKKTDHDKVAANTDWLQDWLKVQHDLGVSDATGRHLDVTPLTDSARDLGTAALRWRVVYADTLGDSGQALAITAGTNAINLTAGDVTLYDATNNADTSLSIGTSATERLLIQVLNGAANQSAESINIVSQTAAAGAHAGQITIGVDDATILTIDDSGINAILGATTAAAATVTTLTASSTVNIQTATNWQLGAVAFTGTMANLNTLRDDSMADALHRHSELSASDGTPNPAVQVDAAGLVGIGGTPADVLDILHPSGTNYRQIRISDIATNATTKRWGIHGRHYTNAQADVSIIGGNSTNITNTVWIGGGLGFTAATDIIFATAATSTTIDGTQRWKITSAGTFENAAAHVLDMNGGELILDADGDASITADTDDRFDFKMAGTDHWQMPAGYLYGLDWDNGTGPGKQIILGRNTNVTTPASGAIQITNKDGTSYYLWVDATGDLRVGTTSPANGQDLSGTVVGTQN